MLRVTLLYDRDCGFCRWCLAKVLAWDSRGRLRPLALQQPEAEHLLPGMSEAERMASWHLVAGGDVYSGGAAFAPLLRSLPGGRALASVAEAMPRAVGLGYRWVAAHRTWFGRFVSSGAKRRADSRIASRSGGALG